MVDIIGNSFDGRGIIPSSKMIKGEYRTIIGNGSGLFRQVLSFDKGTYANASERNLLARPSVTDPYEMTGPFAANILATRQRNGKTYGLFEEQYTTGNTYSDVFRQAISNWINYRVGVTDNNGYDPLGNLTADKVYETLTTGTHAIQHNISFDGSSRYYFIAHVEAIERTKCRLQLYAAAFPGTPQCDFNLSSGVAYDDVNCDYFGILPLINNKFCIYIAATSDVAISTGAALFLGDAAGSFNYAGDGSSGIHVSFVNIIKSDHLTNYIKAVASTVTKPGDYFYFPSAVVPTWMKSKFTAPLTLNYDYPSQISTDKPIWSFQKTSQTLTTGNGYGGVCITATKVYWCDNTRICSIPIGGGSVTEEVTGLTNVYSVKVDSTNIYWSDVTKIQKRLIGGGSIVDLATGLTLARDIAIDASNVYWADYSTGKIQSVPIGGGSVSDIHTGLTGPTGVAVDGSYLYYGLLAGSIYRSPIGGGAAIALATGLSGNLRHLASTNSYLFYTLSTSGIVGSISKNGGATATIVAETGVAGIGCSGGMIAYAGSDASGTIKRLDTVTAWLGTDGKIKVVDGPDTKVETDALSCDMHDDVSVTFDRVAGTIQTVGFTGDDTFVGSSWTSPDGYDVEYGCSLKGAAQLDGLAGQPEG